MIDVGLIGASGYGGLEVMRWLAHHPAVRLCAVQSASSAGLPVAQVFPSLSGVTSLSFSAPDTEALSDCAVVFLAVDNGRATGPASELVAQGTRVIDLSADHRFRDAAGYDTWYSATHPSPAQTATAVYGLPELHAEAVAKASIVGNPGCYATAAILALAPLLAHGRVQPDSLVLDGIP
ncbi:MAG: N-acetyl-gamma-glutamyl-phosphate reductase, partial [bacterium]